MRVEVKKELLRWARERAGFDLAALAKRFPQLPDWESGDARPTLKQLERFAKATYAPIGFLFLPEPPIEHVPIPDLRTVGNRHVERPSPDLLDTVYICQQCGYQSPSYLGKCPNCEAWSSLVETIVSPESEKLKVKSENY